MGSTPDGTQQDSDMGDSSPASTPPSQKKSMIPEGMEGLEDLMVSVMDSGSTKKGGRQWGIIGIYLESLFAYSSPCLDQTVSIFRQILVVVGISAVPKRGGHSRNPASKVFPQYPPHLKKKKR